MLFLFLLLFGGPAEHQFEASVERGHKSPNHSIVVINPETTSKFIQVNINPLYGCSLMFNKPWDQVSVGDIQGQHNEETTPNAFFGSHFSFLKWGGLTDDGEVGFIIRATKDYKDPVNLFFNFGGQQVEVRLRQVKDSSDFDTRVQVQFKRTLAFGPPKKKVAPKAAEETPPPPVVLRHKYQRNTGYGPIQYNFEDKHHYLEFEPFEQLPPLTVVEVVRTQYNGWGKVKKEIVFAPKSRKEYDGKILLEFPAFVLNKREKLRFRVQVHGVENADYIKLKVKKGGR